MTVPKQAIVEDDSDSRDAEHGAKWLWGSLPLTPLEKFLLQCESPDSPMVIRVVMRFSGECQEQLFVRTLQRAIRRHPLLSCRLQTIGRQLCWVAGEPEPIQIRKSPGSILDRECGTVNKAIDLTRSAGLHVSIVMLDDGIRVTLDAHHAVTDGNGLRQVTTEWLHLYHCAVNDTPPKLPVIDPDRLAQRHLLPQPASVAPISLRDAIRNFLVTIRGRSSRWTSHSARRSPTAGVTDSNSVEEILSTDQCQLIQQRLTAWNVKLNDLVMACCMAAFAKLAPKGEMHHRITVLNPTDLRRPSDRSLPAANRFGIAFIRRSRTECLSPENILRGIQDEMTYVRSNFIGVEFIKGLATASKIPGGINVFRKLGLFIPSLQWTCLGDVARSGRRLMPSHEGLPAPGQLRLEYVTGYAPFADAVPISVAACETNQRLTLTVRSSPQFLTMQETQVFSQTLVDLLCGFKFPDADE